jgi:hypothetical protein
VQLVVVQHGSPCARPGERSDLQVATAGGGPTDGVANDVPALAIELGGDEAAGYVEVDRRGELRILRAVLGVRRAFRLDGQLAGNE